MNIKEYIASGILEAYVSGAASEQERREVECLSSVYPEIKAELESLEAVMGQFALDYQAAPPSNMKDKIMAAVQDEEQVPAISVVPGTSDPVEKESPREEKPSPRDPSNFPWRIAAGLLLLVSCGLLYFLITLEDDYKAEIENQRNNITELEDRLNNMSQKINQQEEQLALVTSPTTLKVPLNPTSEEGQENALVFWDSSNQNVYLNPDQLPAVNEDQQYQLWALKDGQPIDLGIVLKGDRGFQQMKSTAEADAFAITVEPLGGSEQPTLEQLKVIGNI